MRKFLLFALLACAAANAEVVGPNTPVILNPDSCNPVVVRMADTFACAPRIVYRTAPVVVERPVVVEEPVVEQYESIAPAYDCPGPWYTYYFWHPMIHFTPPHFSFRGHISVSPPIIRRR